MILVAIIFVPIAAGLAAWLSERISSRAPRAVCLFGFIVDFALVAWLWADAPHASAAGPWLATFRAAWHPLPAVSFYLGADGISLVLLALTAFLGCIATAASWNEITERTGFFHLCLSWTVAGVAAVFCALDLFLFYFVWELDARADVFPYCPVGTRRPLPGRSQILHLHAGERPPHAGSDLRPLFQPRKRGRDADLRLPGAFRNAARPIPRAP